MPPRPRLRAARPTPACPTVVASLFAALAACTPEAPPDPRFDDDRPAGALEVRLFFADEADLDLFVTDPREEALYFGNNPSLGGGELDIDRRCDDEPPRRERARFVAPRAGRYRVGVSYDRSCRFRRVEAPYRIEVEADALRLEHEGRVAPGDFEHIALEFDYVPVPAAEVDQPSPAAAIRSSTSERSARASRP